MTKPHEETWERRGDSVVSKQRGRVLYVVRLYPSDTASLDLAAAAPKMARVLKKAFRVGRRQNSRVEESHTPACWDGIYAYCKIDGHGHVDCEEMHAALTEAGVPLP